MSCRKKIGKGEKERVERKIGRGGGESEIGDNRSLRIIHSSILLWARKEKNRINSHLIIHCATSEGVSKVSERANE